MPMADELEIARVKRSQLLGSNAGESAPKPQAQREGFVEKTIRRAAASRTRAADEKLQDTYRSRKGLDQYNRPIKPRSSGR